MPLTLLPLTLAMLFVSSPVTLSFGVSGEARWSRAAVSGYQLDALFGARVALSPALSWLETGLSAQGGTLGARASDGTRAVRVSSHDAVVSADVTLRHAFAFSPAWRLRAGLLFGVEGHVTPLAVVVNGARFDRLALGVAGEAGPVVVVEWTRWFARVYALGVMPGGGGVSFALGIALGRGFAL